MKFYEKFDKIALDKTDLGKRNTPIKKLCKPKKKS